MLRYAIHMCSVQKFTSILVSRYIHSKYNSQQCSSWSPGSVFTSKHSGPRTADSCLLGKYPVATSFGGKGRGNPRRQQSRDHDTANRGPWTGGGRRVGEHGGKAEATINKQFTRSIQDLMMTTRTLCSEIQPQRECHIQCYCIYWPSVLGYTMPVCIDCPLLTMLACHSSARPASWSRCAHLSLTHPIHRYDHLRWVHGILDHAATMLRPWQWPTQLQVNFYNI